MDTSWMDGSLWEVVDGDYVEWMVPGDPCMPCKCQTHQPTDRAEPDETTTTGLAVPNGQWVALAIHPYGRPF